jgi:hypothetical protein
MARKMSKGRKGALGLLLTVALTFVSTRAWWQIIPLSIAVAILLFYISSGWFTKTSLSGISKISRVIVLAIACVLVAGGYGWFFRPDNSQQLAILSKLDDIHDIRNLLAKLLNSPSSSTSRLPSAELGPKPLTQSDLLSALRDLRTEDKKHISSSSPGITASVRSSVISMGNGLCGRVMTIYGFHREGDPHLATPVVFLVWLRIASNLDYKVIIDNYSLAIASNTSGPWIPLQNIPLFSTYYTRAQIPDRNAIAFLSAFDAMAPPRTMGLRDGAYLLATSDDANCMKVSHQLEMPILEKEIEERGGLEAHRIVSGWSAFNPPSNERNTLSAQARIYYRITTNTTDGMFVSYGDFFTTEQLGATTNADSAYIGVTGGEIAGIQGRAQDLITAQLHYWGPSQNQKGQP